MKKLYFSLITLAFVLMAHVGVAQTPQVVVQAEAAGNTYTSGQKIETAYAGYTGTGYLNSAAVANAFVEFKVSVKTAGATKLYVTYAFGKTDDRSTKVTVNGVDQVASLAFPTTGAFSTWATVNCDVTLVEGYNIIRLTGLYTDLVNIDKFAVDGEQGVLQYELALTATGGGTVTVAPTAGPFFTENTVVTLTANSSANAAFDHWEGDVTGTTNPATVTMSANKTVKAVFNKLIGLKLYCAPDGNDATGDGTEANPFFSLQKAVGMVTAGDTIFMKAGVYPYSTRININTNGDDKDDIVVIGKGGQAILDFSQMIDDDFNQGIRLTGSYWYFKFIDIKGAGDNGLLVERNKPTGGTYTDIANRTQDGHDNTFELCNFYDNRDSGVQLKNLAAYNKFINCDSYFNRDSADGDADGFAPKLTVGTGNYFWGCRAWNNSDDGWDLYLKCAEDGFPQDMMTIMENCWCIRNGYGKDGGVTAGNGNGFKLGGSANKDQRHDSQVIRCLSIENLQKGFDQNNNVGSMTLINNTGHAHKDLSNNSGKSHYTYRIDGTILSAGKVLTHTNNVAIGDGITTPAGSAYAPCEMVGGVKTTCDYATSPSDYITDDSTGVRGPRQANGDLPNLNYMKIKPGNTKLIDKGTWVAGIAFNDKAPDLGAFEADGIPNSIATEKSISNNNISVSPNPVEDVATINYVAQDGRLNISVVTLDGVRVKTIIDVNINAGAHTVGLNASDLKSGVYLLVMTNEGVVTTSKLVVK